MFDVQLSLSLICFYFLPGTRRFNKKVNYKKKKKTLLRGDARQGQCKAKD